MRLERQTVLSVDGIATLPAATVPIVSRMRQQLLPVGVTAQRPGLVTAVCTTSPDPHAVLSDRRVAIANLIMNGGIAQVNDSKRGRQQLDKVRQRRRRNHPNSVFLVIEVSRAIKKSRAQPALGVVHAAEFDLIVEGPRVPEFIDFQEQAYEVEMGLIASLRLTANDHLRHHQLQSATYLLDGDAPPEYRLWFEAGAVDARVSLNLTRRSARKTGADVRRVLREPGTSRSLGLVGRVSTANEDATVEFLVSFTALEQYVKGQVASGELVAGFKDLAAHRFPAAQAVSDVAEFRALNSARNKLAHEGERVDDRSLARRVRTLLIRYLTPAS